MKILVVAIMLMSIVAIAAISAYLGYCIPAVRRKIRDMYNIAESAGKQCVAKKCGVFLLCLFVVECILCLGTFPTL